MSSATLEKTVSPLSAESGVNSLLEAWKKYRNILGLVAIMGVLTVLTDGTFLSPRNLTNLTRQVAINGILAVGMTYVILMGGIDLSVGSVVALAGVVGGLIQVNAGLSQWMGYSSILATILTLMGAVGVGLFCGAFNGWLITRHKIAPFIITLGMMVIARGLALIFAKGAAIAPLGDNFNVLGQGYIPVLPSCMIIGVVGLFFVIPAVFPKFKLEAIVAIGVTSVAVWIFQGYRGLPVPVLLFGILGMGGAFVLQRTRLGRFVLAVGGNPEAAWLAGVPINRISYGIYIFMGALAGLCGAILSARLNGALPTAGELFELDAIAAVVMGGTSLMGGVGSVRGSILGAFFIGILNNGMSLLDVTEFYQKVIKGVIIILAVWFDMRSSAAQSRR